MGRRLFSVERFDSFRREIESVSRWRYSGGADLILVNARYDVEAKQARLDFATSLAMNLETAVADGAIRSVETWFEAIFRFAETEQGKDPAARFASQEGLQRSGRGLVASILSLLPGRAGDELQALPHFVVTDLAR
jgi:hypothetical protein